jgi:hypothetical protein
MEYNNYDRNKNIPLLHTEVSMSHYRLEHLDLSTRFDIAVQMLDLSRPWGYSGTIG